MNLLNKIKSLLTTKKRTEKSFCEKFGVSNLEQLPLFRIHEISAELGIPLNQLVYGAKLKKPFPSDIKLLILDVDGVMTDAGMYYSENGDMMKKFNAKDGMGILQLTKTGFQVGIISSGFKGDLVKKRADILKIQHFYLGREHKLDILKQWCTDLNISLSQVAMIGDDVNDLEVMQAIGFSACPADAATKILEQADYILSKKGGEGCVREFIEDVMGVEITYLA
jgi:3-deoxy-D-manno-octulosonate 8-phosphate phosphatase (KDO 8-P phosphatase)